MDKATSAGSRTIGARRTPVGVSDGTNMAISPWKIIHSHYLVRDPWVTLRADRCEMANGVVLDPYYVQEAPDWVQVVAFDHQDRILITRQYRHGAALISTELPCGTVEPGETPDEAIRRELLEETGCTCDELLALPVLSPNPACYTNRIHPYIAIGTRQIRGQALDQTEEIEFEFLPTAAVLRLVDDGAFPQALHIATLFLALRNQRTADLLRRTSPLGPS